MTDQNEIWLKKRLAPMLLYLRIDRTRRVAGDEGLRRRDVDGCSKNVDLRFDGPNVEQ